MAEYNGSDRTRKDTAGAIGQVEYCGSDRTR